MPKDDSKRIKRLEDLRKHLFLSNNNEFHSDVSDLVKEATGDPRLNTDILLGRAFTMLLGTVSDSSSSLLTGVSGATTFTVTSTSTMDSRQVVDLLKKSLPNFTSELSKHYDLKTRKGIAFDVPTNKSSQFQELFKSKENLQEHCVLVKAESVPDVFPMYPSMRQPSGANGYKRNNFARDRPNVYSTSDGRDKRGNYREDSAFNNRSSMRQKSFHRPYGGGDNGVVCPPVSTRLGKTNNGDPSLVVVVV